MTLRYRIRKPKWWEGHTGTDGVYGGVPGLGGNSVKYGYQQAISDRQGGEWRFCPYAVVGKERTINGKRYRITDISVEGAEEMLACETYEEMDEIVAAWVVTLEPVEGETA